MTGGGSYGRITGGDCPAPAVARDRLPAGRFRVSCPASLARVRLSTIFTSFVEKYPGLQLELQVTDAAAPVIGEGVDLAIRIAGGAEPGCLVERVAPNRRLLCAAPRYLADSPRLATLADLSRHHLLAARYQLPWRLHGPDGPVVHAGRSRVVTNSSELVREFALAGLGIVLGSLWDVAEHLRSGALEVVLPQYAGARDTAIVAICPAARHGSPNVSAFIAHLKAEIGDTPGWERRLPVFQDCAAVRQ